MKKLVLLVLLATTSLFGNHQHKMIEYTIPSWCYVDCAMLIEALITASWAAKYQAYCFDEFECSYMTIFKASTQDSSFFIRFDNRTRECTVEFNAIDDSFEYAEFKKVMDFFLLKD